MASQFGIRFFTSGYERTSGQMASIGRQASGISTGFLRMGRTGASSGTMAAGGMRILSSGMSGAMSVMRGFISLTIRATTVLATVGAVVAGVGIALATKFAKGLMATRESFYLIETALTGVVKNAGQVQKISDWAMKYAATYPAMYGDVMDTMKGLSMMPSLKPMFVKGDVAAMEKVMNIVQSLAAMDPQQGVKGAQLAMREALSGNWRSLQMRFELRPQAVAEAAGLSMEELKTDPGKAIEALDAFTRLNVGADTLRKSAESLGVQWGNLGDKYDIFLNKIGKMGAYRRLVEFLMKMNDMWDKLLESDAAQKFGQNISSIFESVIGSVESIMTGIDWEGKGIFDGIIEAGKKAMEKLRNLFLDAKDFLASAMKLVFVYIKMALIFSIKEIFFPVGKMIAETIGNAFMETIRAHPMLAFMAALVGGTIMGGLPGGIVAGGAMAVTLAAQGTGLIGAPAKSKEELIAEKKAEIERVQNKKFRTPMERVEFYGNRNRRKNLENLKTELEELEKLPATSKFSDADAALAKLKADAKALKQLWGTGLGLGTGDATKDPTAVGEAAKRVVAARSSLRLAELTGAKSMVDVLKEQLQYEERLLDYHQKAATWEKGPTKGVREAELKKEIATLKETMSISIGKGVTRKDPALIVMEEKLATKQIEAEKLKKAKTTEVGDITRYTGAELAEKARVSMEKEKNILAQTLAVETQIAKLKKEGGEDVSMLVDLETKLLDLSKQKIAIEQQYTNAKKQQVGLQSQIQTMEVQKGLSALDLTKGMFQTFGKFVGKQGRYGQVGGAKMPGMGKMSWGTGVEKSTGYRTKGIPKFLLKQEEVLKEKLGQAGISDVVKKLLLEKLHGINVEQFQMAKGGVAKGAQFLEANKFMEQLQAVDTKLQEEQIALVKEQAGNIAKMVVELKLTNQWLSGINGKVGGTGSQPNATPASLGNKKIGEANPSTAPSGAF